MHYTGVNHIIFASAVLLYCLSHFASGQSCYMAWSDDSKLPKITASCYASQGLCYKSYKNTTAFDGNGNPVSSKIEFSWYCSSQQPDLSFYGAKCGDVLESTDARVDQGSSQQQVIYTRFCTCCGNLCNDASFDERCNEIPLFTKQCYGAGAGSNNWNEKWISEPELPEDRAKIISCTETQACFKKSTNKRMSLIDDPPQHYIWGCATPPFETCGESYSDGAENTRCTCCGDLCNGKQMDTININTTATECRHSSPPSGNVTTASYASTTNQPPVVTEHIPTDLETALTIAASVLGSLLGVFLIAVIILFAKRYWIQPSKAGKHKVELQAIPETTILSADNNTNDDNNSVTISL